MRRNISRILLVLALLGGPFACGPRAAARVTTAGIGGLLALDLSACVDKAQTWEDYDRCEAALEACAESAKTVSEYDVCSDKVVGR